MEENIIDLFSIDWLIYFQLIYFEFFGKAPFAVFFTAQTFISILPEAEQSETFFHFTGTGVNTKQVN